MKQLIFFLGALLVSARAFSAVSFSNLDSGQFNADASLGRVGVSASITNAAGASINYDFSYGAATELRTTNTANQVITIVNVPAFTDRRKRWMAQVVGDGVHTLSFVSVPVPVLGPGGGIFINPPPTGVNQYLFELDGSTLYYYIFRPAFSASKRAWVRNSAGAGDVEEGTAPQILDWNGTGVAGMVPQYGTAGWTNSLLRFTPSISPAQITATQNDYNPASLSTAVRVHLTTDVPRTITGIQTDGSDGRFFFIWNGNAAGTNNITLTHEGGTSSTTNRFTLPNSVSVSIVPGEGIFIVWSSVTSRWRTVTKPPVFTGDSGSGGSTGLVPAPAAGDAAAGKVLAADSTWVAVGSASINNTAFGPTWDGATTTAPSRNAVYDQIHLFDTDDDGKVNVLDIVAGIPKTDINGVVSLATPGTDYAISDNWVAESNATNSTLAGIGRAWSLRATNHVSLMASAVPTTPIDGVRLYADTTNHFGWVGTNGFTRILDGVANTGNHIYTLPDKDGTVAMTSDITGGGTAGTVINTGASVLYNVPYYTDTTGTNIAPSIMSFSGNALRLGADAAAPVAKTIIAAGPRGGTDSNTAGVTTTIAGSPGTGTGVGGSVVISTSAAGGAGSATNASSARITVAGNGVVTIPGTALFSSPIGLSSGVYLTSPTVGTFQVYNISATGFTLLKLGIDDATPDSFVTIQPASGVGTDKIGGDIIISGGQSTGTGTPGKVKFNVSPTGTATSSTPQTLSTAIALGGTLKVDTTTTGNVGAGEDTLITYTIPAAQLGSNGDYFDFRVWGTCAANTNTKDIKVYFGGTVLSDGGVTVLNGVSWSAHGMIARVSATTQTATCELTAGAAVLASSTTTSPAETLSGTVVFKVTGTSAISPNDNDIVQNGMVLRYNQGL